MSLSILEILQIADYNFQEGSLFQVEIGKDQIHNAVTLLTKGYSLEMEIEPLLCRVDENDETEINEAMA